MGVPVLIRKGVRGVRHSADMLAVGFSKENHTFRNEETPWEAVRADLLSKF